MLCLVIGSVQLSPVCGQGTAKPALPATEPTSRRSVIDVTVDERVELMCIIFRLAGSSEYRMGRIQSYARDVDRYFAPVKDHAAVGMAQRLRNSRGISYDAPMSLAVHLSDAAELKPLVPLETIPTDLDSRWQPGDVRRFLAAAREFARESHFDRFMEEHRPLYAQACQRMRQVLERDAHLEWFDAFFGVRSDVRFHLALGMLNGGGCYGSRCRTANGEDIYCILGVWASDRKGNPTFGGDVVPTVVHEFGHSYTNPLVEAHLAELEPAGMRLFPLVADLMRRQAYGNWRTMMYESLLRACVVRYRVAHEGAMAGLSEIAIQHQCGFVWTGELSTLLADYEQHRQTYPTVDAFMPRVVQFFNEYAEKHAPPTSRPAAARPVEPGGSGDYSAPLAHRPAIGARDRR
jgi:hypothetical protein